MSAYVVMMREKTTDTEQMRIYAEQAPLARDGHTITPIVKYGTLQVLEGPAFEGCLIHRFPSMQQAENWYRSSSYQEAMQHRHQGADYRVFIVDGVPE